jgi:hypothetical protein
MTTFRESVVAPNIKKAWLCSKIFFKLPSMVWGMGSGIGTETFPKSEQEPEPEQIVTGTVPQHCLQIPVPYVFDSHSG